MARIKLPINALVSRNMASAIQQVISLRDFLQRTQDVVDEICGSAAPTRDQKALLETSDEALNGKAQPGSGEALYDALEVLLKKMTSADVKSVIKQFDQG